MDLPPFSSVLIFANRFIVNVDKFIHKCCYLSQNVIDCIRANVLHLLFLTL